MSGYNDDPNAPSEEFDDTQFDDIEADSYDQPADSAALDEVPLDDDGLEEWADQPVDALEGDAAPAPKKKSSALLYIILAVVVLGGGGFAFMKFSGSGTDLMAVEAPADGETSQLAALRDEATKNADVAAQQLPEETPAPAPEPASAEKGFMNSDDAAPADGAPPALPDSPAMTAVEVPAATPPSPDALPAAAEKAPDLGLKPVSDFPSVDLIKKADTPPAPATQEPAPLPVPDAAPVATPAVPAPAAADAAALQAKLDAAQARAAALEKDLAAAKQAAAKPAPAPAPAADGKVEALQAQVKDLQEKLAARPVPVAAPAPADTAPDVAPAPAVPATPAAPKPVKPAAIAKAPVAASAVTTAWELRGAQPGQAMLARKSTGDLRTVSVGDTLPGIGKIVAIEQSPSGWVVKGTQGRVTQ